ncbi:unnamed protein product [Phytophthora lilii]|uniref:Unnamed protein product n=1 Tax=Phytophthora lilii TaxID=2077276 RepID=A0A9W6TPU0_9STRA|nr:unnamed protein product [Phytophthora lilii]
MKFTLPEDAFPEVKLSKQHEEALIEEAETVVRETIAANEAFLADGGTFRDPRWRLVRKKDGLSVYHQKQPSSASSKKLGRRQRSGSLSLDAQLASQSTDISSSSRRRGRAENKQHLEMSTDDEVSVSSSSDVAEKKCSGGFHMVLHGTVDGNLDDAMYGTFAATNQAWMWRISHINDRLDDARILATIRGPTQKDPFRFLGIKWFVKERPAVLTGIVQQRDYLVLEATGLTRDSKGKKVGYYLMHSISLPGIIPDLDELGLLRGQLSLCFIDRQRGSNKVEKYCRNFSNPKGKIIDRVAVAITADALICAANIVDYAYIKKLTWLMKHKGEQSATSEHQARETSFPRPKRCETCDKGFSKFSLTTLSSGASCQICYRVLCLKCSIIKKMTVDVSETGSVKQCPLRFCLECLREAKEKNVWEMALSGMETASEASTTSGSARSGPHR